MCYVFTRRGDRSRAGEATAFVVLSLVGFVLNELLMWADTAAGLNYMLVKVGTTAIVILWNSWSCWLDAG